MVMVVRLLVIYMKHSLAEGKVPIEKLMLCMGCYIIYCPNSHTLRVNGSAIILAQNA